ncbi:hypothetical protein AKG39_03995 [Acetobacterium bakii]|uniref:Uncharacterized protein n=1 Tax=Acetobacterium bakii TaxID=52689 RepID=A0A0L6U3I2_9FIRM|nr:hypothetical protein AKG39_03995 [Acetobacterium bakii]
MIPYRENLEANSCGQISIKTALELFRFPKKMLSSILELENPIKWFISTTITILLLPTIKATVKFTLPSGITIFFQWTL